MTESQVLQLIIKNQEEAAKEARNSREEHGKMLVSIDGRLGNLETRAGEDRDRLQKLEDNFNDTKWVIGGVGSLAILISALIGAS